MEIIPFQTTLKTMSTSLNLQKKTMPIYQVHKFMGSIILKFKQFSGSNISLLLMLDHLLLNNFQDYMFGVRIIIQIMLLEILMSVFKFALLLRFKMSVTSRCSCQCLNLNPLKKLENIKIGLQPCKKTSQNSIEIKCGLLYLLLRITL